MIHDHDCGCSTYWHDELNHPMYNKACSGHRGHVPDGWIAKPRPRPRQTVEAAA